MRMKQVSSAPGGPVNQSYACCYGLEYSKYCSKMKAQIRALASLPNPPVLGCEGHNQTVTSCIPHLKILNLIIPADTFFYIRSHSQISGIRTWMSLGVGIQLLALPFCNVTGMWGAAQISSQERTCLSAFGQLVTTDCSTSNPSMLIYS